MATLRRRLHPPLHLVRDLHRALCCRFFSFRSTDFSASQFTILFMTSGYMWTQIRRPLYVQAERNGQVSYIAGGYQTQLGAEVHIISAICACLPPTSSRHAELTGFRTDGVLGFSAYILAYTIPKLTDPVRQRLGVYVWTGVFIVMSGVLMNIFHMKQPGCESQASSCADSKRETDQVAPGRPLPHLLIVAAVQLEQWNRNKMQRGVFCVETSDWTGASSMQLWLLSRSQAVLLHRYD